MKRTAAALAVATCLAPPGVAFAQAASGAKPWGRVSFYTNVSDSESDGVPPVRYGEFITTVTYQMPDQPGDGFEYGVDLRESTFSGAAARPQRVSIYEGYLGARLAGGAVRARVGHLWLTDLGALGSVAGALVEVRQSERDHAKVGRVRVGAFGGLEPNVAELGYAQDVKKFGGYVAIDGDRARRHVLGFVDLRDGSVTERSVVTTTNFVPVGRRFFLYQGAEYDVRAPAGQAQAGLSYLFANARFSATSRVDLQGTYNRGRSVDTRGLAQDILSGRPLSQTTIDGLLYESVGGRVTVEPIRRVRVYAGYSRDKTNRDDAPTGRTSFGGYAGNVAGSGFDLSASDSLVAGSTRRYHARYVSVGRQVGRIIYISGDYGRSLSVIRFSRTDGIEVETRPQTTRLSANGVFNVSRPISLMCVVDRTLDDQYREIRVLAGITYRFQ